MSVGHLPTSHYQDFLYEQEMKYLKECAEKLSVDDEVKFLNNEGEVVSGRINKFFNWYQVEVITETGKRWGVSAQTIDMYNKITNILI